MFLRFLLHSLKASIFEEATIRTLLSKESLLRVFLKTWFWFGGVYALVVLCSGLSDYFQVSSQLPTVPLWAVLFTAVLIWIFSVLFLIGFVVFQGGLQYLSLVMARGKTTLRDTVMISLTSALPGLLLQGFALIPLLFIAVGGSWYAMVYPLIQFLMVFSVAWIYVVTGHQFTIHANLPKWKGYLSAFLPLLVLWSLSGLTYLI